MDYQSYAKNPKEFLQTSRDFIQQWDWPGERDRYRPLDSLCVSQDLETVCKAYVRYSAQGLSHVFPETLLQNESLPTYSNLCVPLLHNWSGTPQIDPLVIISHPEDAERICKSHIQKAPIFTPLLHNSVISTTDNTEWKEQRSSMNMAFLPSLSLKKVFPTSNQRASQCVTRLRDISEGMTRSVNMSEFFLYETLAQLQLSMFGMSEEFQDSTNVAIRNAFSGIDPGYVETYVSKALQELQTQDTKSLFHPYFQDNDDPNKTIGNLLILTFAGHDTSGHTLTFLLYELCKNLECQQELIREIDTYWSRHSDPTYESFHELPFMTQCITETLRLWPALANGTWRQLEHDDTLQGHHGDKVVVKKGTYVQIMNWTRHRNKELWGESADIFDPHRHFEDSEIWSHKGFATYNVSSPRFSPFTYGPRNCIGKNFSHMELRLILLHLFKHYTFTLSKDQAQRDDQTNLGLNSFTMGPRSVYKHEMYGMQLDIHSRQAKM